MYIEALSSDHIPRTNPQGLVYDKSRRGDRQPPRNHRRRRRQRSFDNGIPSDGPYRIPDAHVIFGLSRERS